MERSNKVLLVILIMFVFAFSRLIPHIPNFTPSEGIAIFGAAYLGKKYLAVILPLFFIYITDFIINNTVARDYFTNTDGIVWFSNYMIFNAIALILIVLISNKLLIKVNFKNVFLSALTASFLFFIVSNFGVLFSSTSIYSKDISGLLQCYVAGLPFFRNSLLSTLFFTSIIFSSYYIITALYYSKSKQTSAIND